MCQKGKASAPCAGYKVGRGIEPPTGRRVSRVKWGRDIMDGGGKATPVEQVGDTAQDAILRDEGGMGMTAEEGVDGGVVIEVQAKGKVVAEGSQGEGTVSCKELSSLLGYNPRWTAEEAGTHLLLPDFNEEGAPRSAGGISI